MTTFIVIAILGYILLDKMEINNHKTMLKNMIMAFGVSDLDSPNIDKIIKEIKKKTSVRVTIIDKSGVVLHESNRDKRGMENHLDRPEIKEVKRGKFGSSIRHSNSVNRDFLYVAKRFNDKFVRMAYALKSIQEKFFTFWLKAIGLFSLALLALFWIVSNAHKLISRDLNKIDKSLENLLNKKYEIDFDGVKCCREFDTISKQIEKVSKKLKKREQQKSKYTKKLKLLNKKQSDIISSISHEFKNPIAAIMGYTQTIKEEKDLNPQIRDKFLDKVLKNGEKITHMIDRLSFVIKLENDKELRAECKPFKLQKLIKEVRDNLLQKYKDRDIIIKAEDITLVADRDMFDNLMTNLIENALKYSEDDVVVEIDKSKIEVIDQGIGIQKEDVENITKRFYRVDSSWDNSIGVGLYIVKYILKLHDAKLEVKSTPNSGSTFGFSIDHLVKED